MHPILSRFAPLASALAIVAASGAARADLLPPQACQPPSAGSPCSNAGPQADQAGVCTTSSCARAIPDGGHESYSCVLCEATGDGGTGDGGGSATDGASPDDGGSHEAGWPWMDGGGDGGGTTSDGGVTPSDGGSGGAGASGGSSSCAASPLARDGATGFGMLGLGLGALAWARRRRA